MIRCGAPYKSKTWGTIEGDCCKEHFAEFVQAISNFTPDAAVAAKVGGKKTTKKAANSARPRSPVCNSWATGRATPPGRATTVSG